MFNVLGNLRPRPNPATPTHDLREGMTVIQAIVFDAVREIIKPGLPPQAAAFWPMVELELSNRLKSCEDESICEKLGDALDKVGDLYQECGHTPLGELWKPQS